MRKCLHLFSLLLVLSVPAMGQTVVLDFEDPATSTTFQYFGGSLEGVLNQVVPNPNPTGINTSATVAEFIQGSDAPEWGGAFSNPNPTNPVDLISASEVCIDVHRENAGNLVLKLEQGTAGDWEQQQPTTAVGEWETICFDVTQEFGGVVAAGNVYDRIVLFFDFGTPGTGTDVTNYFDNIVINQTVVLDCEAVLDFEEAATSTTFQYFGGSLEGVLNQVVANPNPTGINTSATVAEFIQGSDAPEWGGAFSNPNPTNPVDLIGASEVCIDVHRENAGNLVLKLEQGTAGDWEQLQPTTAVGEWETICFDVTQEFGGVVAANNIYERIVLFFDFGTPGTGTDVINYFDNIEVCGEGGSLSEIVTFTVDMNEYPDAFTQAYVSGDFNGWSGDANPMDDSDGDGVWTAEIEIPYGQYEYKFTLDNFAVQEEFNGLEECTSPPGGYVNRLLTVNGSSNLGTVCWNSCYACGASVQITFELGFDTGTDPSADGVWLAGGGSFDSPGGPFRMDDSDGDGVYTITIERAAGFSSFYTFANGNCPDFSCKEDISGQECANPDNFNDRFLPAVTQDTTIATCFGLCTDNSDCSTIINTDEVLDASQVSVAPNPTTGDLFVTFSDVLTERAQIRVINTLGSELMIQQLDSGNEQTELNLSDLSPGVYYLHVQVGERFLTRKIVKQ